MAGAVGDLFNSRTRRPNASKEDFFSQACLVERNPYEYRVSRFIYAGSESVETAWIGYVAVATDQGKRALGRRDILIAWRGTATTSEWRNNLQVLPRAESDLFPGMANVKVHRGFHSLYTGTRPNPRRKRTSAREQVRVAVEELVKRYEDISITVTGFSLGAALATLTAMDMVTHGYNKQFMVTAFTFGGPRVGNHGFAGEFVRKNLRLLRIRNIKDSIPNIPPRSLSFTNVGKELIVDTSVSSYLKQRPLDPNSSSGREAGSLMLWCVTCVHVGLWVFMYLNKLWLPLIGLTLILIWDKINGGDKYQTLCWVCYEASMFMLYKRLWFPLSVLIVILHWAENNRRDRYENQTMRWVCYGFSLVMVHESNYWIPLLGLILYFIWGEIIIRWYRDVGEYQDIGEDQDGCDLIIISEDGDGDGVVYGYGGGRVRDDYGLPPNWWAGENRRGMVQGDKDGC
ncbi:hypothetical protein V6N13_069006 [Hibiscus sabdariffa]